MCRLLARLLLLLLCCGGAFAEYPEIRRLSSEDELFRQLQADLERYFRAVSRGQPALPGGGKAAGSGSAAASAELPPRRFFSLRPPEGMDLFTLAARLNLPYDTLATLNGLDGPAEAARREVLIVPSQPGLFVPERPASTFQEILASVSANGRSGALPVVVLEPGGARRYRFFPGQTFGAVERAFFLNILFRFPLALGLLTSTYGSRLDPMTGQQGFHHGVDIAAPVGLDVYAARDGTVLQVEEDPQLGKVVVLQHDGGYQTVYGHLSRILVALKQNVRSGTIIGNVGTTGYSTGPHLHFEIRRRGSSRDPLPLLPAVKP